MNLKYSQQIFEKYPNIKFNDNQSNWSPPVVHVDRWSGGHEEANSRFL